MNKIIALVLIVILVYILPAFSHPPSEIVINYDLLKSQVGVVISHSVRDPAKHYIYKIEVYVNEKKVITQDTIAQTNEKEQSLLYIISGLKDGDKIIVRAECNKGGEAKKSVIIKQKE